MRNLKRFDHPAISVFPQTQTVTQTMNTECTQLQQRNCMWIVWTIWDDAIVRALNQIVAWPKRCIAKKKKNSAIFNWYCSFRVFAILCDWIAASRFAWLPHHLHIRIQLLCRSAEVYFLTENHDLHTSPINLLQNNSKATVSWLAELSVASARSCCWNRDHVLSLMKSSQ